MRVLVCGASGGIGAACVAAAERAGAKVVGVDRDSADRDSVDRHSADVTAPGGAERALDLATEELGGVDGVVHAVGASGRRLGDGPVSRCTDQAWQHVQRVNAESVFRLLRAALPRLTAAGGGSVVVVGSALARTLDADFLTAAYAASKSAVEALVRLAAYEGAPHGVRVNVVTPGLVDTPMAARALGDPRIAARLPELMPLGGRAGAPAEVADVVCWLLSPAAAAVTGAVVPADRGWTLR
jgi:NAD(P)-dependent dehydrogenase (short-subunit alcohol dehydrogenase family)